MAGASIASSLMSSSKAGAAQGAASDISSIVAMESIALSREQMRLWKKIYMPLEKARSKAAERLVPAQEEAAAAALEPIPEFIAGLTEAVSRGTRDRTEAVTRQAAADVDEQFDVAEGALERDAYGLTRDTGRSAGAKRQLAMGRAGTRASMINAAREGELQRQERAGLEFPGYAMGAIQGVPTSLSSGAPHVTPAGAASTLQGAMYGAAGLNQSARAYGDNASALGSFALDNPLMKGLFGGSGGSSGFSGAGLSSLGSFGSSTFNTGASLPNFSFGLG